MTNRKTEDHLLAVLVFVPALHHLQPFGGPLHLRVFLLSGKQEVTHEYLPPSSVFPFVCSCPTGLSVRTARRLKRNGSPVVARRLQRPLKTASCSSFSRQQMLISFSSFVSELVFYSSEKHVCHLKTQIQTRCVLHR